MITPKQIKDTAALVGAVAGIIGGADKIKTIFQKWRAEYKEKRSGDKELPEDTDV